MNTTSLKSPSVPVKHNFYKDAISELLDKADVVINGNRPWDIIIHDESLYPYLLKRGSLGLGESYMKGLWDCEKLDEMMFRIIKADLENAVSKDFRTIRYLLKARILNLQSRKKAYEVGKVHYDVGNDLYKAMLDEHMMYSCGYWENALSLEEAQHKKLDLICKKLQLEAGQRVLDIGCGWGGFAQFATENYKAEVVGITISEEQAKLAKQRCKNLPVEIRIQDYRSLNEKFDRVVSIGMFEHVGYKNYATYMNLVHKVLKEDGRFLLSCIGGNISTKNTDPWINKYIFPNSMIPSAAQIGKAIENKFILEEWQNFGAFYDLTIMEWLKRFKNAWKELKDQYDEHFYRMWIYYLSCSAASFRAKKNNLWQMVFSLY